MPPIVVVAYNRSKSLSRLLTSLANASYPDTPILLIISIDYANDNQATLEVANDFNWNFGEKKIVVHKANLGLRKHVLKCVSYAIEYESVIILEDDLYVSPNFYFYAREALMFSVDKDYIGGISLYNHQLTTGSHMAFTPLEDGYDNWYFQYASSWGQAWNKSQIEGFLTWYHKNNELVPSHKIPKSVTSWSDKSWLKFFIAYLIEKDKFFLYPKISLTTNFSDVGTHFSELSTTYQVPLFFSKKKKYDFSVLNKSHSVYDAFFENQTLHNYLGLQKDKLLVDLYGQKEYYENQKYILSKKIYHFKIVESFGRFLRPIDSNIREGVPGFDFFLYDTSLNEKNKHKETKLNEIQFHVKVLSHRNIFLLFKHIVKCKVISMFKK
jgi:glycosyltransferase involved in cell wall biosynthesis